MKLFSASEKWLLAIRSKSNPGSIFSISIPISDFSENTRTEHSELCERLKFIFLYFSASDGFPNLFEINSISDGSEPR